MLLKYQARLVSRGSAFCERPRSSPVVRTVEAGFLGLNQRIHSPAIRRNCNANASPITVGQSVASETRPCLTGIL